MPRRRPPRPPKHDKLDDNGGRIPLRDPFAPGSIDQGLEVGGLLARDAIIKRAFPINGKAGRSRKGSKFKPLNPGYRVKKQQAGRHPVPDQRYTSQTANALRIIKRSRGKRVIGFAGRQDIAAGLQQRNDFFGLTSSERKQVVDKVRRVLQDQGAKTKVNPRQITIEINPTF